MLNILHEPSLEIVATLVESALKAKSYTPDECPGNSKAREICLKSPLFVNTTSQTFTSGANPRKKY
jgi:hypothetical protein